MIAVLSEGHEENQESESYVGGTHSQSQGFTEATFFSFKFLGIFLER